MNESHSPDAANRQESAVNETRPELVPYDEPQTWYFTFGFAHAHPNGYYVIEGMGGDEARERMHDVFGRQWAFQYDAHDWFKYGISQAEKDNLTEVT